MSYYLGLSILSNSNGCRQRKNRKRLLSAEARHILSEFEGRLITENDIAREGQGRPFFPKGNPDFSISHSGTLAAVSLIRGKNLRTGCDVELVRPRARAQAITEDYFTAPERDYIFSQACFDEAKFFSIWTLKECFIKLRGLSVFDMAKVPSFIRGDDLAFDADVDSPLTFYLYELDDANCRYILATAIEGEGSGPPEIRWFSRDIMPCRCIARIIRTPEMSARTGEGVFGIM
jgi:phosphopantetheinyl transferase